MNKSTSLGVLSGSTCKVCLVGSQFCCTDHSSNKVLGSEQAASFPSRTVGGQHMTVLKCLLWLKLQADTEPDRHKCSGYYQYYTKGNFMMRNLLFFSHYLLYLLLCMKLLSLPHSSCYQGGFRLHSRKCFAYSFLLTTLLFIAQYFYHFLIDS